MKIKNSALLYLLSVGLFGFIVFNLWSTKGIWAAVVTVGATLFLGGVLYLLRNIGRQKR